MISTTKLVGVSLAIFGAGAIIATFQINPDADGGWGARIFPIIGSMAVFAAGVTELMKNVPTTNARSAGKVPSVMMMLGVAVGYIWLMSKFGYLISTGVTAPIALWVFGIRNPAGLILATVICPTVYHFIFFVGLGVFPPLGEWFDLLDVLTER